MAQIGGMTSITNAGVPDKVISVLSNEGSTKRTGYKDYIESEEYLLASLETYHKPLQEKAVALKNRLSVKFPELAKRISLDASKIINANVDDSLDLSVSVAGEGNQNNSTFVKICGQSIPVLYPQIPQNPI